MLFPRWRRTCGTAGLSLLLALPAFGQPAPHGAPGGVPGLSGTPKPANPQKIIDAAEAALHKEYAAGQKDPANPDKGLRDKSDYFLQNPAPDLKPDALLSALARPATGDPRAAAYVRWQLLSGLTEPIDPKDTHLLTLAIEAYRKAPLPAPHFGLTPADQRQLDALAASARREEDVSINSKVDQAQQKVTHANRYALTYRDEIYNKLPKVPATFLAAFQDADERLKLAAGVREWMPHVIADIHTWMASPEADAQSLTKMADAVAELRFRAAPPYYDHIVLGPKNKLTWEKKSDSANPEGALPKLQQALQEAAQKPRSAAPAAPATRPVGR
jgi:hypothetical protein